MNSKIRRLILYPKYSILNHFSFLRPLLSEYEKEFGPPSLKEKRIYKIIKESGIKRNSKITIIGVLDGRLSAYLESKGYFHIEIIDFDKKRLNKFKNRAKNTKEKLVRIDNFKQIMKGEVVICDCIMSCLNDQGKRETLEILKSQFRKIIIVGIHYKEDRLALGPDAIGSYACRQFKTTGMDDIMLSVYENYTCHNIDSTSYLYSINVR